MRDVEALDSSTAMAAHFRHFNSSGPPPPCRRLAREPVPPVIFNFIGTLFHPEWGATSSLELSFYMDARKDAELFVVGPNGPGDFSYVDRIETHPDWSMFGFRLTPVPDMTGEETFHDG
jgi:hypothetical protein